MASQEPYSDLQVASQRGSSSPEVITSQYDKIVLSPNVRHEYPYYGGAEYHQAQYAAHGIPSQPRRICGIAPKLFWALAVGGTLIVVAAAVAGGLVGSKISSQNNSASTDTNGQQSGTTTTSTTTSLSSSSTTSATITTPVSATLTTSTLIGPTQTLYRDCPSSNDTVYNALGSTQYQFRKICSRAFKSDDGEMVNKRASSLNDCIDLCAAYNVANKTEIAAGKSRVCNEVCWRNSITDKDWPGQCFASTTTNSSATGFVMKDGGGECDSAAWINQVAF